MMPKIMPLIDAPSFTDGFSANDDAALDDIALSSSPDDACAEAPEDVAGDSMEDVEIQREIGRAMLASHQRYRRGESMMNVRRFLETHHDMPWVENLSLLVMLHRENREMGDSFDRSIHLKPHAALFNLEWPHHVVMVSGGRVYDQDYTGEPGTPFSQYAEEMLAGGLSSCDAVFMPACVLMRGRMRRPLVEHIFSGEYSRTSVMELVERFAERYGPMKPLGLERRERNYDRWGLMYEDSGFRQRPERDREHQFGIRYEAGKAFSFDAFEALLMKTLAERKQRRPKMDCGFISIMLQGRKTITEAALRDLVERVVRPMDIEGPIAFEVSSVFNPLPEIVVIDGW